MPDITMCVSQDCPSSKNCYRHQDSGTVPDAYWQSVCDFKKEPVTEFDGEKCIYFVSRSDSHGKT